ncbi:MAG: hypothetical protein ACKVG6_06120 [Alphaproteobacteria bacterium]|jgi:hypothetical protein
MFKVGFCSLATLFLVGCAGFSPKADIEKFPKEGVLFSSPSVNSTIVQDPKNYRKICMGRGADALFETSESGDFKFSLISIANTGGDEVKETDNAGEEEMIGRTPAVLLARELFYRACELTNNAQLNREEAVKIFNSVLNVVGQGWEKESENTKITIGDSISTKNTVEASPPKVAEVAEVAEGADGTAPTGANGTAPAGANGTQ